MTDGCRPELEHRHLRPAIEFAVDMAAELVKRRRNVEIPRDVRAQFGSTRIPTAALGRVRRAIEQDDSFRQLIAAGAIPELVDPIGILWLQRPDGWEQAVEDELAAQAAARDEADLRTIVRREEKRRLAAEQATVRSRADIVQRDSLIRDLRDQVEVLRSDLVKANEEIVELRTELVDVRNEVRHARDRERAANDKLEAAREATRTGSGAPDGRQPLVADEPEVPATPSVDVAELADIAHAARALADRATALLAADEADPPVRPDRRQALRLPGGLIGTSAAAAEFLLRSDAAVLVDGYNVSKLAWPTRPLEAQRTRLLDALENAARRFGSDITVVFDGATVVGAHSTRRRLLRVVYSPEGVIADDVIRDEVRRLPASRPVVVVTNDAEIVHDVRALGANIVPSNALLAVL